MASVSPRRVSGHRPPRSSSMDRGKQQLYRPTVLPYPTRWRPRGEAMKWVTRERPKIDRIACPWLIRRFIEPAAEFLYVPADQVFAVAAETGAVPYDIPG